MPARRLPYILPTSELPTGRQSWGRQFWYHQSSGLPTLIMTIFFNVFCWILLDWVLGMFTEEFAILGKIPLKIVRIKSQQTKSNFKWWFGSLSQSFFSSATQIIIRFCTGPNHHYFPILTTYARPCLQTDVGGDQKIGHSLWKFYLWNFKHVSCTM